MLPTFGIKIDLIFDGLVVYIYRAKLVCSFDSKTPLFDLGSLIFVLCVIQRLSANYFH